MREIAKAKSSMKLPPPDPSEDYKGYRGEARETLEKTVVFNM